MSLRQKIQRDVSRKATKKFWLFQNDFKDGFCRITEPGVYTFMEDIEIDVPFPTIQEYILHPYENSDFNFGIHAGIIIECDNVIIDLNKHRLSQSHRFYSSQRFFNLIQLNNFPFIPKPKSQQKTSGLIEPVGPITGVTFPVFKEPKNIIIRDGRLGLSSHNAIHGNNNKNILLEDLFMSDFEVAGVTLNNCHHLCIHNVDVKHSLQTIPFNTLYNTITLSVRQLCLLTHGELLKNKNMQFLLSTLTPLWKCLDSVKNMSEIIKLKDRCLPFKKYYSNYTDKKKNWLSPCGQYGISITNKGPSIHNFSDTTSIDKIKNKKDNSQDVVLSNLSIEDIKVCVDEFIALKNTEKDSLCPLPLTVGSIVDVNALVSNNPSYVLLKILQSLDSNILKKVTTLNEKTIKHLLSRSRGGYALRGLDNMGHVSKGAVSIRMDSVHDYDLINVTIKDIENCGNQLNNDELEKHNFEKIEYVTNSLFDNQLYIGNYCYGIMLSSCCDGKLTNINISHLQSDIGTGIGCFFNNYCVKTKVKNIKMKNVDVKNKLPTCFIIDNNCEEIHVEDLKYNC